MQLPYTQIINGPGHFPTALPDSVKEFEQLLLPSLAPNMSSWYRAKAKGCGSCCGRGAQAERIDPAIEDKIAVSWVYTRIIRPLFVMLCLGMDAKPGM